MWRLRRFLLIILVFLFEKGLVYFDNNSHYFAHYAHDTLLSIIIYVLIIVFIIAFLKIRRSPGSVFQADDELSMARKWKVGYLAYILNLWLWLLLFSDRVKFSDITNLIGGGIILTLIIGVVSFLYFRIFSYEEQNQRVKSKK